MSGSLADRTELVNRPGASPWSLRRAKACISVATGTVAAKPGRPHRPARCVQEFAVARPSASSGSRGWPAHDDDGWGPSTAVYSASAGSGHAPAGNPKIGRAFIPAKSDDDAWAAAGPRTAREQRAVRAADRRMAESIRALRERRVSERGLPAWAALLLL